MADRHALKLFALEATAPLGVRAAVHAGVDLAEHEERDFEDGEHKARPLEPVRDADAYVLQSLHADSDQSANDKLCRLLFFLGALRQAGAARVTAVVPYLCYARKDRVTKPRDPVTTRYVAALFEAVGADRVLTIDAHNLAAYQNAFRCRTEHLEARPLMVEHLAPTLAGADPVVMSPDVGGYKRARRFADALAATLDHDVPTACMEKQRSAGVVSGEMMMGDVEGRTVVIIDDLIGAGTTMRRAAHACRERGAARVLACATHGLFVEGAADAFADDAIDSVVVTSTVPPFRLPPELVERKVDVLDVAPLLGTAIHRLHTAGSITDLVEM